MTASSSSCAAFSASRNWPKAEAYKDNKGRLAHRAELVGKISGLTMRFQRDELLPKLEDAGIPAGPINDLEEVFADPQVVHRGMLLELKSDAAKGGKIPGIRTPIMLDQNADGVGPPGARGSANTPPKFCARSARDSLSIAGRLRPRAGPDFFQPAGIAAERASCRCRGLSARRVVVAAFRHHGRGGRMRLGKGRDFLGQHPARFRLGLRTAAGEPHHAHRDDALRLKTKPGCFR